MVSMAEHLAKPPQSLPSPRYSLLRNSGELF
jgi:hypothetical protein